MEALKRAVWNVSRMDCFINFFLEFLFGGISLALPIEVVYLRIGSCLACIYRVMDARGKFGEHETSVRVAQGAAESTSSFFLPKCIHNSIYAPLKA